jgi:hypothetical protein
MITKRTVLALFIFTLLPGVPSPRGSPDSSWMRRVFLFCSRIYSAIPASIVVEL